MSNIVKQAQDIVAEHDLGSFIEVLLNYWKNSPTTLGHGFVHVLTVAVYAYELGLRNNYSNPEHLFVGGLFHDIHRPAEGADGEEDQTKGAVIVKELFDNNKIDADITKKVVGAINSHDDWRGSEDIPSYDLILSIADKKSHNSGLSYHYVWASNKHSRELSGKPIYTNHLQIIYAFNKYQSRAWEIFLKHPINGTEEAIDSYLAINRACFKNYESDREGKHFDEYVDNLATQYREDEIEFLTQFGQSQEDVEKLMARMK